MGETTPKPVVRIPKPTWADQPEVWLDSMRLSQYESIRDQYRGPLLALVDEEVRSYVSDSSLVYDASDLQAGFPSWERLTGEYYLGDETYSGEVSPVGVLVSVQTRFLEHSESDQSSHDYLGLEVWLRFDPVAGTLSIARNTDSSSI